MFGNDRALSVTKGQDVGVTVNIPRGYQAKISVTGESNPSHLPQDLGKMMAYELDKDKKHINLKSDSPDRMIYEASFDLQNIQSDIVVTLEYEKVKQIHFNAYMWTQTVFAKNRINIGGVTPTESNSNLTTTGDSFVWEWDGITTKPHTWEMDQLEINHEAITVPMVSLNQGNTTNTERTTLSTGTEVAL
ncbi:hypothetical protein EVA_15321, partial [gut metagenome]